MGRGTIIASVVDNFIILTPFFIFAIVLSKGKGASLLAGYNTMYGICFSILLWALNDMLKNQVLFIIGCILFVSLIVFSIVYSNIGNRFKNKLGFEMNDNEAV